MDLQWLRDIAHTDGPFATVYLDITLNTPDASRVNELRWAELRAELDRDGAHAATLTALDDAVRGMLDRTGEADRTPGQLLIANGAKVLLAEPMPSAPDPPRAHWSALPDLLPALALLPERLLTVVAVVDGSGADVYAGSHTEHVDTAGYPMHKVRGGAWSHLHNQRHVEEHQRASAEQVAHTIGTEVATTGARLLVLAGEVQARSRVRRALDRRSLRIMEEVQAGGRAAGSDVAELEREVAGLVNARIARARRDAVERYEQAAGRDDRSAVEGVPAVTEAFRAAEVDALYLDAGAPPGTQMWIGPEPTLLATRREDLEQLGIAATGPVQPADALLRAAAGTGASFHPVGGGRTALAGRPIADGVGAILRSASQ